MLRIEDTDAARSEKEFEADIIDSLEWMGLKWDGPILKQSELVSNHQKAIDQLLSDNKAYEKDGAIWFRVPPEDVTFTDIVRGEVTFKSKDIEDFVIRRSDGSPIFYLVGVVDDNAMGISHVIRGEDLLSNTPKQILLQKALGFTEQTYAHLPLILNPDRTKLSKRLGATSVREYKDQGFCS